MNEGQKYKITYRLSTQRVTREGVATYLDVDRNGSLVFSGRPEFGTVTMQPADILHIEPVPQDTNCYMNRRIAA